LQLQSSLVMRPADTVLFWWCALAMHVRCEYVCYELVCLVMWTCDAGHMWTCDAIYAFILKYVEYAPLTICVSLEFFMLYYKNITTFLTLISDNGGPASPLSASNSDTWTRNYFFIYWNLLLSNIRAHKQHLKICKKYKQFIVGNLVHEQNINNHTCLTKFLKINFF
jgi:hypothetical protein